MSWQSDLFTALSGSQTLTALATGGIYADVADLAATVPYIVYETTGTYGETAHDGTRGAEFPNIAITAYAATKAGAISIIDAVVTLLDGNEIAGNAELSLMFAGRSSDYEPTERLYSETVDFLGATNT